MQETKNKLGIFWNPIWKLCEFQIKRRCTDIDATGKYMPMALTGLAAANKLSFFAGVIGNFDKKEFNITTHVRSLKDIIALNPKHVNFFDDMFSDDEEYLDYLKSSDGMDTLFMFLVKNKVNSIPSLKQHLVNEDNENEYLNKEPEERFREDQRIINGEIVTALELTVSTKDYNEVDYDTDKIVCDFTNFRNTFNNSMSAGHSELSAFHELEKVSVQGRISMINDFVTLFAKYVSSNQNDTYFINSLTNDISSDFAVFASKEDVLLAEENYINEICEYPIKEPKIIKL